MAQRPEADVIRLTLPARAGYVGIVRLTVSGIANRMGFAYEEIEDIKLAVAEACTNAVNHAYDRSAEEMELSVTCRVFPDRLVIEVADQGKGFWFDGQPADLRPIHPDADLDDVAEGGLGLFLIHALMDEVDVQVGEGVTVSMTKYVRGDGVACDDRADSEAEA